MYNHVKLGFPFALGPDHSNCGHMHAFSPPQFIHLRIALVQLMVGWLGMEDRACGIPHVVHRMWYTACTPAQRYYVNLFLFSHLL